LDYASLLDIAKHLLAEGEPDRTAETILRRVVEFSRADRGFIVVREGKSYEEKFAVRFDAGAGSGQDRRVSRSLVRRAIATGTIQTSDNLLDDPLYAGVESIESIGPRAVLVVPLTHAQEIYGVVYLERALPSDGFSEEAVRFVSEFAVFAALFLRRAAEEEALRKKSRMLERDLFAQYDFRGVVTCNEKMHGLLKLVGQVAASDSTVLIRGETGTGKELIAQALHVNSARANRPLVVLHCTALPSTILESELFGHVKGAFTGAERERPGRIAAAHGGTLFLDEVAEIPSEVQAKLLRFLQFGEIQRLGADRVEKVDVRVVAATHRNLDDCVRAGTFRQDLYYRLKVIELELPPLRDRPDDIPLLVESFLTEFRPPTGERRSFTKAALAALEAHNYPGNVRELRHIVERASVLATSPALDIDLLPADLSRVSLLPGDGASRDGGLPPDGSERSGDLEKVRRTASDAAERDFLESLLDKSQGNISLAARSSGIHRSYLQRLIAKHNLRRG
jgi:transcriptional regulator with GAF, ATPase, and Fis domain